MGFLPSFGQNLSRYIQQKDLLHTFDHIIPTFSLFGIYIYIYVCVIFIYIYIYIYRGQVKIGGPEQAPGPHPFHTRVPYPRSIPPWRIRSIPLFHTSDPYVIYIYMIICFYYYYYYYLYFLLYIYIYLIMCNLILHLYAHIWAHVHTWVHTCKNTFTMPKPCDCVRKSVPAALTAATYFVVWW